jgi:hypothetical protein
MKPGSAVHLTILLVLCFDMFEVGYLGLEHHLNHVDLDHLCIRDMSV